MLADRKHALPKLSMKTMLSLALHSKVVCCHMVLPLGRTGQLSGADSCPPVSGR